MRRLAHRPIAGLLSGVLLALVPGGCAGPAPDRSGAEPARRSTIVEPYERKWSPIEDLYAPSATTKIIRRADWAHAVPIPSRTMPMGTPWRITIHHEGGTTDFASRSRAASARRIESIRRFHVDDRGWADIGYHFVIDPAGRIWEGRPLRLEGAHVAGQNPGNIGICVLGNFQRQQPTPEQLTAIVLLTTTLQRRFAIDDAQVHLHGDMGDTDCPGRNLRRALRRERVFRHAG